MSYKYDFTISGISLSVVSDEEINIEARFQPFKTDTATESELSVNIVFDTLMPDEGFHEISKNVYRKNEKLYTIYKVTDSAYVVREEFAVCAGEVTLHVPVSYKEYFCQHGRLLNFISLERMLITRGRALIHASGVIFENKAYLFSAPSGVGKSTQAALWESFANAQIINGDKIFLATEGEGLIAYGSPTAGTSGIYKNISAQVGAIFMLEQSSENRLEPLSKRQALLSLYSEAVKSAYDEGYNTSLINLIAEAIGFVEVYKFKCLPKASAVQHILDYLKRGNKYET